MSLRDASKMKGVVAEIKQKLLHRNKIIKMADSSAAGWGTVQEYELNDLTVDSDDDRRIRLSGSEMWCATSAEAQGTLQTVARQILVEAIQLDTDVASRSEGTVRSCRNIQ